MFLNICLLAASALTACGAGNSEKFEAVKDGDYKVVIRSEEPLHSGIHNIDICVLAVADTKFPPRYREAQCFLQGYDLDGLTVKWLAPRYINVYIKDGWVSEFKNNATVSLQGTPKAVAFHISLYDSSSYPQGPAPSSGASSSAAAAQSRPGR